MGGRSTASEGDENAPSRRKRVLITQDQLEVATKHFCENRHNAYGVPIPMFYDETATRDFKAALAAAGIEVKV